MKKLCKDISNALPAALTWALIVGCSLAFFYILVPAIVTLLGFLGYILSILDVLLFFYMLSNLFMANTMDPGILPFGKYFIQDFFKIFFSSYNIRRRNSR